MSLQARASAWDHRLYNPNRDVAHCFGSVCQETVRRLLEQKWEVLRDYRTARHIGDREIGEVASMFMEFVTTATDYKDEKRMTDVLMRVGWYNTRDEAQFAFLAVMATVMMGYFFTGVREASLGGEGPCHTYGDLMSAGRQASQILTMPRWKRRFMLWKYNFRLWLLRCLGADPIVTPLQAHLEFDIRQRESVLRNEMVRGRAAQQAKNRAAKAAESSNNGDVQAP